jgi:hypothetical protein
MLDLHILLLSFGRYMPLAAIWTVGIVLAFARWRRHAQLSLLIIIAFGLELAHALVGTLASYWLNTGFRAAGEGVMVYFAAFQTVLWVLDIVAWALVLIALFRWRYPPNRLLGHDGQLLPEDFPSK